jgi:hypothetical protein
MLNDMGRTFLEADFVTGASLSYGGSRWASGSLWPPPRSGVVVRFFLHRAVLCDNEQNMNIVAAPSPFLSLPVVIRLLREAVGRWGGRGLLSTALALLLYRRLGEIGREMERLVERFQAGRLSRCATRAAPRRDDRARVTDGASDGPEDGAQAAVAPVWPRRFAWLVRLAGYQAAGFGSQLQAILEHPEMVALLAAAPQSVRILRPLCRMLGVETSRLRPHAGHVAETSNGGDAPAVAKRVRVARSSPPRPVAAERIPLPRGVLSAARRQGYGKR